MELVPNPKGLAILVDYAHTPKLAFVLQSLRELTSHRIITVFGLRRPGRHRAAPWGRSPAI
jgi:UDP-N-acetylmuramyl tripeptide synthase